MKITKEKQKILLLAMMSLMTSCSADMDDYLDVADEETTNIGDAILSRTFDYDSLELGKLVQWDPTEEMQILIK